MVGAWIGAWIKNKIFLIVAKQFSRSLGSISETQLFAQPPLLANEVDMVEFLMRLEDEFGFSIEDEEKANDIKTVQDAIDFVLKEKGFI